MIAAGIESGFGALGYFTKDLATFGPSPTDGAFSACLVLGQVLASNFDSINGDRHHSLPGRLPALIRSPNFSVPPGTFSLSTASKAATIRCLFFWFLSSLPSCVPYSLR